MGEPSVELPGLASSLALSFLCLAIVCLLAYLALRWLARRGVGGGEGGLRVVGRCPLEARRSVYLVKAGGRCFLVGVGDGPISLLAEMDPAEMKESAARPGAEGNGRFGTVLARMIGRRP